MRWMVQYLEGSSDWSWLSPQHAKDVLLAAGSVVPLSRVAVGWNLSVDLLRACREACDTLGAELYLWHPLLTSDGSWLPPAAWRVVGLNNHPISAHLDMPEFSFLCPNRKDVRETLLIHLANVTARFPYNGVFLDRMRFPSPAQAPFVEIGCCCDVCQEKSASLGLSFNNVRSEMAERQETWEGRMAIAKDYLSWPTPPFPNSQLAQFLNFRSQSITACLSETCLWLRQQGLNIGLDCFSPMLTRMVGQDLPSLSALADWVKIMTYGHVYAPAGIPGELLSFLDNLVFFVQNPHPTDSTYRPAQKPLLAENQDGLATLSKITGLVLPQTREDLADVGMSSAMLQEEVRRAISQIHGETWAGIELVCIEGVTRLREKQIRSDSQAFATSGADGLALSWDLWHIPISFLQWVQESAQSETERGP